MDFIADRDASERGAGNSMVFMIKALCVNTALRLSVSCYDQVFARIFGGTAAGAALAATVFPFLLFSG
jgi:hypothetical protein